MTGSSPRPSIVTTSCPTAAHAGTSQDGVGCPSISTMHAPHCPSPQPKRVPLRSRSLRKRYSSGASPRQVTSRVCPLTSRTKTSAGGTVTEVAHSGELVTIASRRRGSTILPCCLSRSGRPEHRGPGEFVHRRPADRGGAPIRRPAAPSGRASGAVVPEVLLPDVVVQLSLRLDVLVGLDRDVAQDTVDVP